MDAWFAATRLWAQATVSPGAGDAGLVLAIRRWWFGLTLSTPDNPPGLGWLAAIVLGLGIVLVGAMLAQGPARALGQAIDAPGLGRLIAVGVGRFRRGWRLLAIVVAATVVSWTVSQTIDASNSSGRSDLERATKGRPIAAVAIETGLLAGLVPLRDLVALGNAIPMLAVATVVAFGAVVNRRDRADRGLLAEEPAGAGLGVAATVALTVVLVYRAAGLWVGSNDLPLVYLLGVEVAVVPPLLAIADGAILAWVFVELRDAGLGGGDELDGPSFDGEAALALLPASTLACLLAMPGRYVATASALAIQALPSLDPDGGLEGLLRWSVGPGVIWLQGAALPGLAAFGALTWSSGTSGSLLAGIGRLFRAEGGRFFALIFGALLVGGALAGLAYLALLAFPPYPWLLEAADAYAHYATLAVGLVVGSSLVELGRRALPVADVAAGGVASRSGPGSLDTARDPGV